MSRTLAAVADVLSQKPEVGLFSSILAVALSPIAIISLISAVFGLCITVMTLVIKIMDMMEKIRRKKRWRDHPNDFMIMDGNRYRLERDEDEEE